MRQEDLGKVFTLVIKANDLEVGVMYFADSLQMEPFLKMSPNKLAVAVYADERIQKHYKGWLPTECGKIRHCNFGELGEPVWRDYINDLKGLERMQAIQYLMEVEEDRMKKIGSDDDSNK